MTDSKYIDLDAHRYATLRLGADLGIDLPPWEMSITVEDLRQRDWPQGSKTNEWLGWYGDDVFEYAADADIPIAPHVDETYTGWCARILNECHRHLACAIEAQIVQAIEACEVLQ